MVLLICSCSNRIGFVPHRKLLGLYIDAELYLDDKFESGVPNWPGTRFVLQLSQTPMGVENQVDGSMQFSIRDPSLRDIHSKNVKDASRSERLVYSIRESYREDLPEDLSVLFVDDDSILRRMFSRLLNNAAPTWTIHEASNGETALRILDDQSFDIIFVDQYM